jgi:hypothetical protein
MGAVLSLSGNFYQITRRNFSMTALLNKNTFNGFLYNHERALLTYIYAQDQLFPYSFSPSLPLCE